MSNIFGPLSDDEVRQISLLVESLDHSSLDFLQLELGDMKLTISKGNIPATSASSEPRSPTAAMPTPPAVVAMSAATTHSPSSMTEIDELIQDGTIAIVAPIMGRFYAKPDPGAAPFVTIGDEVNEGTTVALIEVMKVFNAVPAGIRGVVTEICVQDTEIIEYGQVIFRIRPT